MPLFSNKRVNKTVPKKISDRRLSLPVNLFIESRNNSRVSILKDKIHIRIPRFLGDRRRNEEIEKLIVWASKQLEKRKHVAIHHQKDYLNQRKITFFDGDWKLEFASNNRLQRMRLASIEIEDRTIIFKGPFDKMHQDEINEKAKLYLIEFSKKFYLSPISKLITQINDKSVNKPLNQVRLKYLNSRWGSCSRKQNINISVRLLLAPKAVVEYVLLHELVHLIEMNHSKRYWSLVKEYMPDYKVYEIWLKQNGHTCDF